MGFALWHQILPYVDSAEKVLLKAARISHFIFENYREPCYFFRVGGGLIYGTGNQNQFGQGSACFKKVHENSGLQSTLVISKSKGPSETLQDIRTSTCQMCSIEENTDRTTKFHN